MVSNGLRWGGAAILLVSFLGVGLVARQEEDKKKSAPKGEIGSQTRFLRRMYATDKATFGDAVRLLSSLLQDKHVSEDHEKMLLGLRMNGIARREWTFVKDESVRKGVLAYMLLKVLEIEGGVTLRLFGVSERYALKELNYIGILDGRFGSEFVSGRELIDVMQRARIYKEEGNLNSVLK